METLKEKIDDIEENALIEKWIAESESGEEPGESLKNKVLHRGDDDLAAPMKIASLKSAGWTKVYHTQTGEMSLCNNNMLRNQLRKKLPGTNIRAFDINPPAGITVFKGTCKCMLHSDDENRAEYDKMGFAVCRKANLASPHQVTRHMQKRHKVEWAAIQDMKQDKEKQEDREFQKKLYETLVSKAENGTPSEKLEAMTPDIAQEVITAEVMDSVDDILEEAPLYVSDKPKVTQKRGKRNGKK